MNDKKTWIAVLASIAFIMVYTQYVIEPYQGTLKPQQNPVTDAANVAQVQPASNSSSGSPVTASVVTSANDTTSIAKTTPSIEQVNSSSFVIVETDKFIAKITPLGGRISSFLLRDYRFNQSEDRLVDLVTPAPDGGLPATAYFGARSDVDVKYNVTGIGELSSNSTIRLSGSQRGAVQLTGTLEDGSSVIKQFEFNGDSFLFDTSIQIVDGPSVQQPIWIDWTHLITPQESKNRLNPLGFKLLGSDDKITTITAASAIDGTSPSGSFKWLSIEDKYFLVSLIPSAGTSNGANVVQSFQDGERNFSIRGFLGNSVGTIKIFAGPKDSRILDSAGYQLHRNIDLGIFSFLAFPLLWLLRFFEGLLGNWGLAIIALTLFVKTAFLPLTKASLVSMRAMSDLQPEIKALRERITDPTQLNQEMLTLYRKRGVNPMGGCFPMLIQIPVFLGLYNALLNAMELRHAPFALWIQDLSSPERFMIGAFPVQLMVLILGISMFVQQYMTPTPGMEPAQRKVLLLMPLILTVSFIVYPLPAGLVLYWIVNNTISITQQSFIKRERRVNALQATIVAGAAFLGIGYILSAV